MDKRKSQANDILFCVYRLFWEMLNAFSGAIFFSIAKYDIRTPFDLSVRRQSLTIVWCSFSLAAYVHAMLFGIYNNVYVNIENILRSPRLTSAYGAQNHSPYICQWRHRINNNNRHRSRDYLEFLHFILIICYSPFRLQYLFHATEDINSK